jgi:opacity protein-like surface antigen
MASRFVLMLEILTILMPSLGVGQDSTSKVQVFGGYSLLHLDTGGLNGTTLDTALSSVGLGVAPNLNGWEIQIQYNVKPMFGIVADFGGNYGSLFTSPSGGFGLPSTNSYSFLFGPVVQSRAGKLKPFAHALFGANRLNDSQGPIAVPVSNSSVVLGPTGNATDTAFSMALGGGVDYNLTSRFGLRLGQLDYLYTGHNMNTFANTSFQVTTFAGLAAHENNLRFSTGIIFRF